ncbi:phage tail-collar fiber domain-containing protein [Vagococcus sp. WN89Y]|uniref:phage tail protein n=1 Tax=Vagococcus sp. WN89Y TaxID=3457258 RepID=UPI003FCCC2A2
MTVRYYAILTNQGAARLTNATMVGSKLNLTQMAVGDANGVLPTPDPAQTKLINQKRIAPLNLLSVDPNNPSQIIAEQIIPENEGGFWIREIGLYDDEGVLIAVANCPETYKPQLQEGSCRTQTIRMILVVTSTEAITLKIDPSVVLATRKYVDDGILELKLYVDDGMAKHIAAQDPHSQYAPKASPSFTGTPKAPTPAAGNNTTQIATTAFVKSAIAAMVASAPAALDTLNELATALGNDPNFSTTMLNALAGKQPLDNTLTNLSGKDVAGLLAYLGLVETINKAAGAVQRTGDEMSGDLNLRNLYADGVVKTAGEVQSLSANSFRMIYGNYGAFWRQDGADLYLMITDAGNHYGGFNGLRPFIVNLGSGKVTFGNGINGDCVATGEVRAGNGAARLAADGNIYGSLWGGWLSSYLSRVGVQDVRLGGQGYHSPGSNVVSWTFGAPFGHVLTGISISDTGKSSADNVNGVYYRPIQKLVNGTWYNVASV